MSARLEELDLEYRDRLHNDALFSARVKLANQVLEELEDMPRSTRPHGYAAYLVVAALDKALPEDLPAQNARLLKALMDADSALTEAAVGYEGTAMRMCNEALLPKAQRSPDFDHEDMVRYNHFATMARSSLNRFKKAAGLR